MGREITQGMSAKSAEISDALQRRADELTQTLSTVARDINATLTGRVEDVSRSLGVSVDQFKEQVVTPMQDLSRRLDSSRAELGDKVGEHAQQVTAMLDLHKASMGAAFDSHKVVVADATQQSVQIFDARLAALAEAADQSTRIIDVRLADMVEAANRNTETIDERLVARIQTMSEVLTRAASEAESIWSARGAAVANAIRAKVDDLREVIEGKGADLVTALGERGDDVSARFAGVGERAMHTLDQQMAGLATLLTRRTDELIAAVNGSAADPVRALSALTGQLRSEVADSSEALRNVAADVTQRSAETIEALLKRLTEQVEASSVSLSETVTRSAENSVGSLSGTGDRLRHELTSVIDNLGQTSAVIDQAIGSAGDRLTAVQGGLATRVEEFQHALGGISSQVAALGRLSASTQSDASTLAGQLAQHAEALAIVGRDLAQQQQSLDSALERRRSSLQALIGDISGRSEAFEATLGRFAANVEDSFARSQARAQEISAALAAATRGASIAVAGQFETIRDTAAKERDRTTQTLQATVEQTNAQLTGALDHAADRFRQSVAEVKDMASQVQRELDQTRQELRRGVLDLPQETSETTDAMRRVVSDQIRALKELAALVSDSGATYDVVEPTAATAVAGARFEKPLLRAMERTRELEAPSQSEVLAPVGEADCRACGREPDVRADWRVGAHPSIRAGSNAVMATVVRRRAPPGSGADNLSSGIDCRSWATRMALEPPCGCLPRRAGGDCHQRRGDARGAEPGNLEPDRQCGCGRNVGSMAPRRYGRCVAPALHGGGPTGVRRPSATLSHRRPVPGDDNPLYAGVRAPIVEDWPERPRRRAVAGLSAVQHRQGLHDSRACLGEARLDQRPISRHRCHAGKSGHDKYNSRTLDSGSRGSHSASGCDRRAGATP